MSKLVMCLDMDGVVHSYTSGWKGIDVIPDPPVPGALLFIKECIEEGWQVAIHSSRSEKPEGIEAMREWLAAWWGEAGFPADLLMFISYPISKPPAFITIDDRALTFTGDWSEFSPRKLKGFRSWTQKKKEG